MAHRGDCHCNSDIRPATAEDRAAVEEIVRTAYAPYITRIGREPGPMLDDYGKLIREGCVYVVEQDGVVRGILVLIPEPEALLLDNIAVSSAAQGLGLGKQLLIFAEQVAHKAGYRSIRLYTNVAMTENIGLYLRIGYRETHRAEENGYHRVYMMKALSCL